MNDVQIHWFSIINSLVVVFFLSGILTMIMIRTLRRDIAKYNTDDNYEDTLEETGWKLGMFAHMVTNYNFYVYLALPREIFNC